MKRGIRPGVSHSSHPSTMPPRVIRSSFTRFLGLHRWPFTLQSIRNDVEWMGWSPVTTTFSSDYFMTLHKLAVQLIKVTCHERRMTAAAVGIVLGIIIRGRCTCHDPGSDDERQAYTTQPVLLRLRLPSLFPPPHERYRSIIGHGRFCHSFGFMREMCQIHVLSLAVISCARSAQRLSPAAPLMGSCWRGLSPR